MKEEASRRPICPWLAAVVVSLGVVQKKSVQHRSFTKLNQMENLVGARKTNILGTRLVSRVGLVRLHSVLLA